MELIHEIPPAVLTEYGIEFFLEEKPVGITAHLHIHPAVEFVYIKQGVFHIEAEHGSIWAHAGDLVVLRSNTVHMIENVGEGMGLYYVLKMSPAFLLEMFQKNSISYVHPFLINRREDICHLPQKTQSPEIGRLWGAMIGEYERCEPTYFAMQRLLACEFLLTCARLLQFDAAPRDVRPSELNERSVRIISESVDYIHANYAAPISAVGCASLAHLSYNHYAKLFRAVTGKTFKEYLTNLRMTHAHNRILSSSAPIYEIAAACGYDNYSYFIVEFKKMYHSTPGQFRKSMRSDIREGRLP